MLFFLLFYANLLSFVPIPEDCHRYTSPLQNNSSFFDDSCCFISKCSFKMFYSQNGGAIYYSNSNSKELHVHLSEFVQCCAVDDIYSSGGAIYATTDILSIYCSIFDSCNAVYMGQSIYSEGNNDADVHINTTSIIKCASAYKVENPFYSLYLNNVNIDANILNSTNNFLAEYGASFGLLNAHNTSFEYCTVCENKGRNIIHLTARDNVRRILTKINIVSNIPKNPAVIMFNGYWLFQECAIVHNYGSFYSLDWNKEGILTFNRCKCSGFVLSPSENVRVLNMEDFYKLPSYPLPYEVCSTNEI